VAYDARVSSARTFADVLAANETYANGFPLRGLQARATKGLAVLTCIDSRIEPLAMARSAARRREDSAERRRPRHRRRTPHARVRLVPARRRPSHGHRTHGLPNGDRKRRRRPRSRERSWRTRHAQPRVPRNERSETNRQRRRPTHPLVALPRAPPRGRIPVRHRHRPPQPPLLNGATSRSPTRWKPLARTLRDLLDSP